MTLIKVKSRGTDNVGGRRNIIINGSMRIAQRATTLTGITSGGYKTCDRWYVQEGADATITSNQSTTVPRNEGFQNSLHLDVTTADASLSGTQYASYVQFIEGKNLQHLKWGTSNAESLTLSFWVYTNKTGTYSCVLARADATNNYQSQTYTVSAANTWEKKVITFIGDTSTVNTDDNTTGLTVEFGLASGTSYTSGGATGQAWSNDVTKYFGGLNVNILDHVDNNFYLTGVQLEVGNSASDFEHLFFAEELQLCKRYYQKSFDYGTAPENGGSATSYSGNGAMLGYSGTNNSGTLTDNWLFNPEMRAIPTVTRYGNSSGYWGRMSMPNNSVTYDNGAGYISGTRTTGLNFGQNVSNNTHICGFGHAVADAEL